MIGVDGGITADVFLRKHLQNPCGITGIREGVVEFFRFLDLQVFDGPFQGSALFPVFMDIGKDLLDISVEEGERERPAAGQVSVFNVPADISLQFGEIAWPPGTEDGRGTTPDEKIREDMRKCTLAFKIVLGHVDYAACHVVQLPVQHRTDGLVKCPDLLKGRIQLNRPDLNNLKGQLRILFFLSVGALVPFQVQNNIIHVFSLSGNVDRLVFDRGQLSITVIPIFVNLLMKEIIIRQILQQQQGIRFLVMISTIAS